MHAVKWLGSSLAAGFVVVAGCVGDNPNESESTLDAGGAGGTTNEGGVMPEGGTVPEAGARCAPTMPPRCEGNGIVTCVDGATAVAPCPLGCDAATVTCKRIAATTAASTVSTDAATFATPIVDVVDLVIETDTGYIGRRKDDGSAFDVIRAAGAEGDASGITYEVVAQASGPQLAVFGFARLELAPSTSARVVGTHAVTFVSATDIVLDGVLSLRGTCAPAPPTYSPVPGPGGYGIDGPLVETAATPGTGSSSVPSVVDTNATQACGGGGGGGNGTDGDTGGTATNQTRTSVGGAGGKKRTAPIFDVPILTGGGAGASGNGGPGGGAAGFVANGVVRVGGTVEAGGCGGRYSGINGASSSTCGIGGGGGGAGGTIFFETSNLVVAATGRILAHGGGGGGGGSGSVPTGRPVNGSDASSVDATPAPGGAPGEVNATFGCKAGGSGSPFAELAGPCGGFDDNSTRAGGGGGGAGIIAARTTEGGVVVVEGAIVSPVLARGLAQTR